MQVMPPVVVCVWGGAVVWQVGATGGCDGRVCRKCCTERA